MKAGELRHRVTIQQKAVSQDAIGGQVETWSTVTTVWAAVEPLAGRDYMEGKRLVAEVSTRVRMRYRAGVVPEMRVVYGTHTYDVVSVIDFREEHRELALMCREVR